MGPGIRYLDVFSVGMEALDLLLMIRHTSERPYPEGTILVTVTEPEQNYINEWSKRFGLEYVVKVAKPRVYTFHILGALEFGSNECCWYSMAFLIWVDNPENTMRNVECS